MDLLKIKRRDPLKRNVEKGIEDEGLSPMSPPDAFAPPGDGLKVPNAEMHPLLQSFRDEHVAITEQLKAFEDTLISIQSDGFTQNTDRVLRTFFAFLDDEVFPHNRREEKVLFPLLSKRLMESGEHSKGAVPTTAVDMLEDDHIKVLQLSAIVFNFFGLAVRLPDRASQLMVLDAAIQQGKSLVELLRLHVFREDNVVFSLAHGLITAAEFDELAKDLAPRIPASD